MTGESVPKKDWVPPKAVSYGSVKEITQQIKQKQFGPGDDVLINDQTILSNVAS